MDEEEKKTKKSTTKKASTTTKKSTTKKTSSTGTKKTTGTGTKKTTTKKTASAGTKKTTAKEGIKNLDTDATKGVVEQPVVEEKIQEEVKEPVKVEINEKKQEKEEIKQEEEKSELKQTKKEKPKKDHTYLKTVLILIIIIIILFLIHFFRNYTILHDLMSKMSKIENTTNYSCTTEYYTTKDETQKISMNSYRKDDKIILERDTDYGKLIIWSDKNIPETIYLSPNKLTAALSNDSVSDCFYDNIPLGFVYYNLQETHALDFMYIITDDTVNGQECYKINWLGQINWYNKDTGVLVKSLIPKDTKNEEKYASVKEWKDLKINNLSDQDMVRPNLIGYNVQQSQQ